MSLNLIKVVNNCLFFSSEIHTIQKKKKQKDVYRQFVDQNGQLTIKDVKIVKVIFESNSVGFSSWFHLETTSEDMKRPE